MLIALGACGFHPGAARGDGAATGSDAPPAACSDGIKDGDETNVDCGGSCPACATCTDHVLPPAINVDPKPFAAKLLSAPSWSCTAQGTTTIDSATGTATSDSCQLGLLSLTNDVAQLDPGGAPVLVVRLQGLEVTNGHVLRIVGDKPVVILVAGDVVVDTGGLIDASAAGATPGPGGSPAACADQASGKGMAASSDNDWGAGGGGFGTPGGQGGYNVINGGAATGSAMLVPLRGGCPGGVAVATGMGGGGGGAVEISATGSISIGATGIANLVASGGGGRGATGGGNGGGAGGGILLAAPAAAMLGVKGALRAHGGAGTSGSNGGVDRDGDDGHAVDNEVATDSNGAAGGGNGNDNGRTGGLASIVGTGSLATAPGSTVDRQSGGRGGGGGGGGRIVITTAPAAPSCD